MSTNRKLTRAERRQIAAAIERAKQTSADKKHLSAQDTISYQRMWPDGICRVTDTRYTKTICYQDINYQLNQDEDKDAMLNQASGDRAILAKKLSISPHQLSYVTQSGEGEGLLFYGNVILPFVDRFPKDTAMYRWMTTKPSELTE